MKINHLGLTVSLVFCVLAGSFLQPAAIATNGAAGDWFFVVVETHVHLKDVEIDSDHPEERRWYVSNVALLPDSIADYSAPKKVNEYFDANIVSPAAKRGLLVEYDDQESQINGGSVLAMQSRAQAEEMRQKDIEDHKGQVGNVYSFNLVFGPAKGEETSQPKSIYRDPKQPNYEPKKP